MKPMRDSDKTFTGTEVGALIESLRGDIALLAEGQIGIREDVAVLKRDVSSINLRLTTVEDAVRISLPDLYARVKALQASRK